MPILKISIQIFEKKYPVFNDKKQRAFTRQV